MMRIVMTGGHGFVAGSIIRQAAGDTALHVLSRKPAPIPLPHVVWHIVDPLDRAQLYAALETIAPTAVIHTAALADIDYCEHHPDLARRVNTELTAHLAEWCCDHGAKLVHCSTDNVFDGTRGDYTESDPPQPVNFYGHTKAESEAAVLAASATHAVVRVALVMGLPMLGAGNSFLARWLPMLRAGEVIGVPDNELRTPIDVVTLGRALLELARNDVGGIIHLSGNDKLNRHQLARRVAARLGYDPESIFVNNPEIIPGRAPRPRDASLRNDRARAELTTPMAGLETGLDLVMAAPADTRG